MLTRDLVRVRVKGAEVVPQYVDPARPELLRAAEALVEATAQAVDEGWRQAELREAHDDIAAPHRSLKVVRGLAKLLVDRCETDVIAPVPPAELRQAVFGHARATGPLALPPDPLGRRTADDVLAEVGERFDLSAAEVGEALYADRADEMTVTRFRAIAPEALLHRYNVALVQAVLLHAATVRVDLGAPSVPRTRQLLRFAKFHQLVHAAERDGNALSLVLDGPTSLFLQTTRYGMQLANFFPGVLLQDPPWQLEATVLWTRAKHRKTLRVHADDGLVSHYADTGAYTPREVQWFAERWEAADTGAWTMAPSTMPIVLGGRGVILPDFTLTDGTRTAHLEIVGFWRRAWLESRLEALSRHGPGNLVLAVSRKLAGAKEGLDGLDAAVIPFAQIVPVREVVAAAERVAR